MPQFSSSEAVSLEKGVNLSHEPGITPAELLEDVYEIKKCADWIRLNGFQKVCLQFPDHMLADSSEVAFRLQDVLGQTVYILGDTAYESCCVDYIAAAHINADAIIHFGPTCFSKSSASISYLNIYEKFEIDVEELKFLYHEHFSQNPVSVVVDSEYIHKLDFIENVLKLYHKVEIFTIQQDLSSLEGQIVLFIGNSDRKVVNLYLTFRFKDVFFYNPKQISAKFSKFELDARIFKKRHFLVEKIKDSKTIGIVIGTLGVKNYIDIIERIKKLIEARGKKYYLISVGKPTVAKLANFPEMDVYVMITCAMNEIYESREFYRPIVTPFDIELALNPSTNGIQFSYDYNAYLKDVDDIGSIKMDENETDVSLLTGKVRTANIVQEELPAMSGDELALKTDGIIALRSNFGAAFLAEKTWKGLEQNLGETEVKLAEPGRKGLAQSYENEKH
ncbi:2-(3-amino-3-carboxypropyl)histidine synthase subunit 2 [Cylas formicarius]|uniref:2-(3-amino-3-carboxypropyl)histidine synthase subunit 2 n=1 Tax=Cylas formicarius TaxID=197179 RepID=UPI002958D2F1|nr:2-(3-amino-3-carboxypropyl)histidine synthase subunit 2 [Cylas formicarius]